MTDVVELYEKVNLYQETQRAEVDMALEGLGRLPEYIPSVGSVLLFNSGENPYQKVSAIRNSCLLRVAVYSKRRVLSCVCLF